MYAPIRYISLKLVILILRIFFKVLKVDTNETTIDGFQKKIVNFAQSCIYTFLCVDFNLSVTSTRWRFWLWFVNKQVEG